MAYNRVLIFATEIPPPKKKNKNKNRKQTGTPSPKSFTPPSTIPYIFFLEMLVFQKILHTY